MRVFVAGATGAIGSPLVATLVRRGHDVTGTTRSAERARGLAAAGATPAVVDVLDREAVTRAVSKAQPDVIVHELTAIPAEFNPRRFDQAFAQTNRLRTEGTDHLIAAAAAAGVRRFITQSFAAWAYARRGSWVKTEDDPLDGDPPAQVRRTLDGIRHLERAALEGPFEGIALRYGWFYGPGSGVADGTDRRRGAPPPVPDHRLGPGSVVVHPPARRGGGDRPRGGARRARCLQRHRRRAGGRAGLATAVRRRDRGAATAPRPRSGSGACLVGSSA